MMTNVVTPEQAPVERFGVANVGGAGDHWWGDNRPHIVAILPRGEALRNFVYTGALDEAARDADVSVLSVTPNRELEELLQSRYGDVVRLRESREKWIVRVQRELLDMAHGRWLWSEAARERWRLRDAEAKTLEQRLKRLGKKLACYPFASRPGLSLLSGMESVSSRQFRSTDEYVRLFTELKPSLVFNGSHVHSQVAMQAVHAAQALGIPTATFLFSWDNLTSQGRIIPLYDYYLVWNEAIRDQLLQIYHSISPEQVFVTGTPQFDYHFKPEFHWSRQEFCARVGADPARPIILYSTGMPNHVLGEPRVVENIAALLRGMTDLGPPQLLVRVYPKDLSNRFDELKRRCPDILFPEVPWEPAWLTPKPEDAYLLTNTLRHAAAGINVASTISLELCMFDKPIINIGYRPPGMELRPEDFDYCRYYDFEHYRPVIASGAIMLARSAQEMPALIRKALVNPQAGSRERRGLIENMFGQTLDGRSGMRVAEQLVRLACANNVPVQRSRAFSLKNKRY